MIYTLTLNPAIDYIVDCDHFKLGEVNRSSGEQFFCGGKGINVAYILNELGYESLCLGFVSGFTGKEFVRGVEKEMNLKSDFIEVKEGMTRINVKLRSDQESELNGSGPNITKEDLELLLKQLIFLEDGDILVLSGSAPRTLSLSIYEDIMKHLQKKNIRIVVDAEGELLTRTLPYKPFLIKPNHHELGEIFGIHLEEEKEIEKYARKLQQMGAQNVLISMAKDGSLLVDENGQAHRLGVAKGKMVNSVGAGDSMVAGFIAGVLNGWDYSKVLKLATATGGATAFSEGLASKKLIEELMIQLG